jgi:hypothetical protein
MVICQSQILQLGDRPWNWRQGVILTGGSFSSNIPQEAEFPQCHPDLLPEELQKLAISMFLSPRGPGHWIGPGALEFPRVEQPPSYLNES